MSDVIVYGSPASTYVRTVRMALEEKGVGYTLEQVNIREPAYRERHPFGKMPAFRHGELELWESNAIAQYVDENFDGPALQPAEAVDRARMHQWVSAVNDYIYPTAIRQYALEYVFPSGPDGKPDREKLENGLAEARQRLKVFDQALSSQPYLAGDAVSVADFFLLPIAFYLGTLPEGRETMGGLPNIKAWHDRMAERPSFAATLPPRPA